MTAAAYKGPQRGPRPASSMPTSIRESWVCLTCSIPFAFGPIIYNQLHFIFSAVPNQMDKTTIAFFCLVLVLFVGQVFLNEQFVDVSGSLISLSLTDLLSLIGTTNSTPRPSTTSTQPIVVNSGLGASAYNSLKDSIISDVKQTVRDELLNGSLSGGLGNSDTILSDDCIDSFSAQQGSDFMKYIPGKNPADYIRKDSVPCYGCSVP